MTTPTRDDVLRAMTGEYWALDRRVVDGLVLNATIDDLRQAAATRSRSMAAAARPGSTAIIPLVGPLTRRPSFWSDLFGGTSMVRAGAALAEALDDKTVERIILLVDSPGGTVSGTPELAAAIRKARARKPVTAVVEGMAASAAYYLASQANAIIAAPSAEVGSIGVYSMHLSMAGALDKAGLVATYISAPGPEKVELSPFLKLSDDARRHEQAQIDRLYFDFVDAVATGRRIPRRTVREKFGGGRTMYASEALAVGMIDGLGTLDEVLAAPAFAFESERRAIRGIRPPTAAMRFEHERAARHAGRIPFEAERAARNARQSTPAQR